MSLQKNITVEYGEAKVPVVCTYHTITSCFIDSTVLPVFDGQGNIIEDGSSSNLVLSSYVDQATYVANRGRKEFAIRNKVYTVPMMVMYMAQRFVGAKSAEEQAYDYILATDPEFSDATIVP